MKTLTVILAAAASVASAQQPMTLTANVPFAFHQKDQAMAAGRYQVKQGPAIGALTISDSNGKNPGVTIFNYASGPTLAKGILRFHCYEGAKCFLSEVIAPGSSSRMVVPRGKAEREMMRGSGKMAKVIDTPAVAAE